MKILALELSSARGSVAWLDQEAVEQTWPNERKNSGPLFDHLEYLVTTLGSPDIIVVGLGPGSYAGVRIAIAAAIGLQAASGARLLGLPSICAMPCEGRHYLAIGDARRQSFFLARIENDTLIDEPELLSEAELRGKLDARGAIPVLSSDHLPQFAEVRSAFPSAAQLAGLARHPDRDFSLPPLQPMYLREPHITMPSKANYPVVRS